MKISILVFTILVTATFTYSQAPCPGTPTVTYSGKTYNTVQIGTQCWLKENLDVGTIIKGNTNQTNNSSIEKYCYNDDVNNCNTYGGLYQWAEAVQYKNGATNSTSPNPSFSGNVQGICPTGWHVPSLAEYKTLGTAVNNNSNALKAIGQGTGSNIGTNTSGFSALLIGYRGYAGFVGFFGYDPYFWSSTNNNTNNASSMFLLNNDSYIYLYEYSSKDFGFSVRCTKDLPTIGIIVPNGGENWQVGFTQNIIWSSSDVTNVKIEYSTNNGTDWSIIIASTPAISGSYSWTPIPYTPSSNCKVRISDASNSSTYDESDKLFQISTLNTDPCPGTLKVTYQGKTYNTIQIGIHCWLKESLDVGTMIQVNQNPSNNNIIEKYCYDNKTENCNTYGALYQWNEAMTYSTTPGIKGICPDGFHIPTYAELQALGTIVSNNSNALKAIGQGTENGTGTNTSGFSALLAGYRYYVSNFHDLGTSTYFWSSSEGNTDNAYYLTLWSNDSDIDFHCNNKDYGFSVRCAKDLSTDILGETELPYTYSLSQNYPNPFNPTTTIGYQLSAFSHVILKVYDILGVEVATLVNDYKAAGSYIIEFNAGKLASGIYFYKIQAGRFTQTKQMVLIK